MKTLNDAIVFMKTWVPAVDGRDVGRFASFVPFDRITDAGLVAKEGMTAEIWGEVSPWTEEEVLERLKTDLEFAIEKAEDGRGITVACMFSVVNMWCHLLENGLQESHYTNYAKTFFYKVRDHYGWRFEL